MNLGELLKGIEVLEISGMSGGEITSVVYDSRKAAEGCLFAAVRGGKTDGASFIPQAVLSGARAVLYESYSGELPDGVSFIKVKDARAAMAMAAAAFYGHPSSKLGVVGITGTNGKTTTSYLIKSVLESCGAGTGLLGTISYITGDKVLPAPNTTPESVDLQGFLHDMLEGGAKYAVLEVSSHALALKRIAGCDFKVKVFTNFTQDHLDFHGSMAEYFAVKKSFFTSGEADSVINIDDPKGAEIAFASAGRVITYGLSAEADITARELHLAPEGVSFVLVTPGGETRLFSPLVGRHNASNILAAAGACFALGKTPAEIAFGIEKMRDVPGRVEKVYAGQDFTILVDYAHTEDALSRVLATAREFTPGRLITVFGCGGDRDKTKRPKMGRVSASLSDFVVLTSDNPRSEDPDEIIAQTETGITEEGSKTKGISYYVYPDREEAIYFAVGLAQKGDTVLIAGKGHEDYQIVGDRKYHFDDRETARDAVKGRADV